MKPIPSPILRRVRLLNLAIILALVFSLFPFNVILPGPLPDLGPQTASAHNLDASAIYVFFDPETQAMLDARIAGGWTPGVPLIQSTDELGLIIKALPDNGTTTGVGGYTTFYIPNGIQVVDAAFVAPDGSGGYTQVAAQGQATMPSVGAGGGPTVNLAGVTPRGPNILGVTSPIVSAANANLGTLPGVYGDTGIFYSTHPATAYGTYSGGTLRNNSGDTVGWRTLLGTPLNEWDAWQMAGFGIAGTTNPAYPSSPIIDSNGRGTAPWGLANAVAGPQSGYAWEFNYPDYLTCTFGSKTPDAACIDVATQSMGPWQRIQYPGSQIADDPPGANPPVQPYTRGADGSTAGYALSPSTPLPLTTGQSNGTPNAIRWAYGQLTFMKPEFAWVKIRVDNPSGIVNATGCPEFLLDTFGGDAGGDSGGKDHIWRYYDPNSLVGNACLSVGKPATRDLVTVGEIIQYQVKVYNLSNFTMSNVIVTDLLPSGVTFLSATPAQNSGPNPLVWNVGTLQAGQAFSALVTVKVTKSGMLQNRLTVTAQDPDGTPIAAGSTDTTIAGAVPLLVPFKTVSPDAIAPGDAVQYTITIKNVGSGPSGNPTRINEYLPAGFTYASLNSVKVNGAILTGVTTVGGTPTVPTFSVPSGINAGNELALTFTAQSSAALDPGAYCNSFDFIQNSVRQTSGALACVQVAGGKIGDTIWRDWDGDGAQGPGEEGIPGVTVKLYASDGTTLLQTTATDANGNYYFPGLVADTYVVEVNDGNPLPGTVQTGDPDETGACTTCDNRHTVTLATDQQYLTADFGYQPTGAGVIGDRVFEDIGNDGVFNGADVGIVGVTVYLYEDANGDGVIDPATDALIAATTTDVNGLYSFSGLAEGFDYIAYVDPADSALATYFGVAPYQTSTPNPQPVANLSGTYDDADFGFWRVEPGSIGDQVFIDNDGDGLYDANVDAPLAGVTVNLYRDGNLVATTVSGPDGTYLFDNLGPGDYTVGVDASDPDVPAGHLATVSQYDLTLAVGQNDLTADFPFVPLLVKTVDLGSATVGQTLNFTIKPYYPRSELLENVRVIDPLPAGTTYVAASANAGGAFGAYTPLPAEPGNDPEGGPAGTTSLDTAITVSTNYVNLGGSVNVTLNVKSSVAVNDVSPTDLAASGGDPTCSGPTPASANVPAGGVGVDFAWSCTLTEVGEYVFSAAAENAAADTSWPDASSASVLASPGGGPDVVVWSLGSNTAGVPGETITSGYTPGIYAFRGGNTREFSKYGISANAWTTRAQPTNGIEKGGALTTDAAGAIYALEGNAKIFYKYTVATNTWTQLAQTSDNANEGGALQYVEVGGVEYVYALLGNSNRFRRYDVAGNTWTNMANTPANVKKGGALTTDGVYLYALQGDRKKGFWRCNVTTTGSAGSCDTSWTVLAQTPANVGWGGALARIGNFIYATGGDGKTNFWRYDIAANAWSGLAATPGNVSDGGALASDGVFVYALQGKTTAFWRYNPATNTWTTLASANFLGNVGQGGALVFEPGLSPEGRFTTFSASPTLVSTGHTIQLRMHLESSEAVNNVAPGALTQTPTGGASASCTGPTPASQDIPADGAVDFDWTCTVTAGANPGSLTFTASATGDGPTAFPEATTRSVLVSPLLSFQATVDDPPPGSGLIENTGLLVKAGPAPNVFPSNTTETATTASIGDRVWADLDGDGVQDAGEYGLAGVEVCVYESDGVTLVACDTTDANGNYRIYGLTPDDYVVRTDPATYPAGYLPTTATSLDVTLISGQQYDDADFGLKPPATGRIGDFIWLDANNDGVQDPDEDGLPGITVTLEIWVGGVWTPVATTTTDANGGYEFTGLIAGDYRVTVDPTSQVASPYAAGTFDLGAAMNPTYDLDDGTASPDGVTLVTLATDSSVASDADFGYNWSGSIGDYVWWDDNINGLQDEAADRGIPNARVQLYHDVDGDGVLDLTAGDYEILRVFTDADGYYLIPNLPPGNYIMDVYEDSLVTDGVRDVVPTTDDNIPVTLGPGNMSFMDADFGYFVGARIEALVFWDEDGNGLFEGDEQRLAGITVTLRDADGNVVDTAVTTATGAAVFLVPAGEYTISYDPAEVTALYPDLGTQTTPTSIAFTAIAGEDGWQRFDFGVDNTGAIGDRVWNDANGDGVQDAGEPGLPGVTVLLYADNDNDGVLSPGDAFVAAQITDASGAYLFQGLTDGNYIVVVDPASLPLDFGQTFDNFGALDDTGKAVISGGVPVLDVDFGYRYAPVGGAALYTLTGRVYEDLNNNGNDDGEPGFAGVEVTIVCTLLGTVTVQTDASGAWTVAGVPEGDTCTVLDADENDLPRSDYVATETPSTPIVVTSDIGDLDFGYFQDSGSISGTVCEGDGNGQCSGGEPLLAGVAITLTWAGPDGILGTSDDEVMTTNSNALGAYSFTGLQPGLYEIVKANPSGYSSLADADGGNPDNITAMSSNAILLGVGEDATGRDFELQANDGAIGDRVWYDLNADGIQDPGEPGLAGVTVELWQVGGGSPYSTTVTDASGLYTFTVQPDDYFLLFVAPGGYVFSPRDVNDGNPNPDERDSDPNPATGRTANFTLAPGATLTNWDAGLYQTSLEVSKTFDTPDDRTILYVGEQVTFNIVITNTGDSAIAVLPLQDQFDTACLAYGAKAATPQESTFNNTAGTVDWIDLTISFLQDLAAGEAFTVSLTFDVVGPSSSGFNAGDTHDVLDVNGNVVPDGSSEVNFTCVAADFGDAPDPSYPTLLANDGARHVIVPGFHLGALIDSEPDGQPNTTATGDDLNNLADEDGVSFGPLYAGQSATITVTASAAGRLDAWLDFGADGSWAQAGDQIFTNLALNAGVNVLNFNVPLTATHSTPTYARFRFSSAGGLGHTGLAADGEVEDYQVQIVGVGSIGDFIYFDSNGNGVQDPGETIGVNGVPITATNAATLQVFTTVSVDGVYLLDNLPAGTYTVTVPATWPGLVRTTPAPLVVTIVAGQNYEDADFGYIAPTAVALVSFQASAGKDGVVVQWRTAAEQDLSGFRVWRALSAAGAYKAVSGLIPAHNSPTGAVYAWRDQTADANSAYWYRLQVLPDGEWFGPVSVMPEPGGAGVRLFMPLIAR